MSCLERDSLPNISALTLVERKVIMQNRKQVKENIDKKFSSRIFTEPISTRKNSIKRPERQK